MNGFSITKPEEEISFFRFAPGIPWRFENEIVKPIMSRVVWDELVVKNEAFIICAGFFLEVLMLPLFEKVLKKNGVTKINWIVPSYYNDFLSIFRIENETKDESNSIFKEHYRLMEPVEGYPVPIFMDREKNVYFNVLCNYGEFRNKKGAVLEDRNYEPFWKQILCNTCCFPYNLAYPFFDKQVLKPKLDKMLIKYGLDPNKPYILIDNNYHPYRSCDGRYIIPKRLSLHHIKTIASTFLHKKYQVIVLDSKPVYYGLGNIFKMPSWYGLASGDFFVLLANSSGIYSSDPNVFLSGAVAGCPRIFGAGNFDDGFSLKDAIDIGVYKGRRVWQDSDEIELGNIIKVLS